MNPTSLPFNSFDSFNSFDISEDDELNAYFSGLLSQQASASSTPAAYNGFNGLTSAETSFCGDLPPDLTWDDYLLITEGLLLEGTSSFDTPAGIAPGVSNINTSGGPSTFNVAAGSADITTSGAPSTFTFGAGSAPVNMTAGSPTLNFGAESAGINMPVGFPTLNPAAGNTGINVSGSPPMPILAAGNTGISMPGALPTFGFTAGSTNVNMPVGLQATIEHPSCLGCGNGGFPNGTNVGRSMVNGGWVGTSQQVHGVHAPLALPNTHLKISSPSPKRPNTPPTTPQRGRERAPSPAAMPKSNTSSETLSPPKRSRSISPAARPPPKRRKDWRKGPETTFRFVQHERSMPPNFRANPDNHGRFQYTANGRRKYLNAPGAVQERRRRREGNQGAD